MIIVCATNSDEWLSPLVSGDRPPPISHFTLTSVTNESAILFGGFITDEWSNKLYIINFSKASVVSCYNFGLL